LGWSQDDSAERSGVSKPPSVGLSPRTAKPSEVALKPDALVAALEKAGVEFIAENGGGAGVRMKKRAKR
jgi:hypothetical protein